MEHSSSILDEAQRDCADCRKSPIWRVNFLSGSVLAAAVIKTGHFKIGIGTLITVDYKRKPRRPDSALGATLVWASLLWFVLYDYALYKVIIKHLAIFPVLSLYLIFFIPNSLCFLVLLAYFAPPIITCPLLTANLFSVSVSVFLFYYICQLLYFFRFLV